MSPSAIQEPKGPEYHEKRNILPHNELRLLSPHHELSVIGYTFGHQVVPLALVTNWTKLLSIALLSSSIGIGLVSSSARVAPIKSQHRTVITHVSEWQKCRPLDGTPSIPEGFEKSRTQSRICLRTLNLELLFFHQALKQKQDSIVLLWLTIFFSPAWTSNWSYLPNPFIDISM